MWPWLAESLRWYYGNFVFVWNTVSSSQGCGKAPRANFLLFWPTSLYPSLVEVSIHSRPESRSGMGGLLEDLGPILASLSVMVSTI